MAAPARTILLVDEHADVLRALRHVLTQNGHQVLAAASGGRALALLAAHVVDLCLVDYQMPVVRDELFLRAIRERDDVVPIILLTTHAGDTPSRPLLQRYGVYGTHDKLDGPERLLHWVELALEAADQRTRLRAADAFAGQAADIRAALTTALEGLRIAQTLVAESGTPEASAVHAVEHRQRIAAELTLVLAKIDEWLRRAAALSGASLPGVAASPGGVDLGHRLSDELPALLAAEVGLPSDRVQVHVLRAMPPAVGDFEGLTRLLTRLLANDLPGPARTITIEATAAAHEAVLTITDRGRAGDPSSAVVAARGIAQADFGGTLTWSTDPVGTAEFVLRLPEPGHQRTPVPGPDAQSRPRSPRRAA